MTQLALVAGGVITAGLLFGWLHEIDYYLHLMEGQASLLWNRVPIGELLDRGDLAPEIRERLKFVQRVRRFAEEGLGLSESRNYTSYSDIGEGPVSWQLTAAPKDRLEPLSWSYPVVGRFPYRGYFDLERAKAERERLEGEGFDTYLRPVGAYSTLGWFEDPILSPMLRYRDESLADLIIHELTHGTVWIRDVGFNESLATFVGATGSVLWLQKEYGRDSREVREAKDGREDQITFRRFMFRITEELEAVYAENSSREDKLARREAVFQSITQRLTTLSFKTDRYRGFPSRPLNNAAMLAYRTYHVKTDLFERIHQAVGEDLQATIEILKGAEDRDDPQEFLENWLKERE